MQYKKKIDEYGTAISYETDGVVVSFLDPSLGNTDYEAYLAWLAEGNEPEVIDL